MQQIDIISVMNKLSLNTPVPFVSEADFQFAFVRQLCAIYPYAKINLGFPIDPSGGRKYKQHVDIRISTGDYIYYIELKYKTTKLGSKTLEQLKKELNVPNKDFNLSYHGAPDEGRYDFIKDINRLENFIQEKNGIGYAIILTNDESYWTETKQSEQNSKDFFLNEGRSLNGNLEWAKRTAETTKKKRPDLKLSGRYTCKWQDYKFRDSDASTDLFRYLLIEVGKGGLHE